MYKFNPAKNFEEAFFLCFDIVVRSIDNNNNDYCINCEYFGSFEGCKCVTHWGYYFNDKLISWKSCEFQSRWIPFNANTHYPINLN